MSSTRSAIAIALCAARVASAAPQWLPSPRGWTVLVDPTGRCSYAVPADWRIDDAAPSVSPFAASPDGRVTATITWSGQSSWDQQTADLRATRHTKVIHEDSTRRFWVEIDSPPPIGVLHIAVAPATEGACTMEVGVSERSRDESRRQVSVIIGTLTAVR